MVSVFRAILAGNALSAEHCDKLNSIQASQCNDMFVMVCTCVCVSVCMKCVNVNDNL